MKSPTWLVVLAAIGVLAALSVAVPTLSAASSPAAKKTIKCKMTGETDASSIGQNDAVKLDLTGSAKGYDCSATVAGVFKDGAHLGDVTWKTVKPTNGSSVGTFHMPITSKTFNGTLGGTIGQNGNPIPIDTTNGPETHPQCWWYINNVHNPPVVRYICAWTVYVVILNG